MTQPPADLPPVHRRSLSQRIRYTPPRAWAPMTDDEWEHVACYLAALDCGLSFRIRRGRPPEDVRGRLDAIFRAVTLKHPQGGRGSWTQLPPEHGKADTVSRTYRRWCGRRLWARLLSEVADSTCPPVLAGMAYWICCAFRRGFRIMSLDAVLLARRLGLYTALPAPGFCLPNPVLSEQVVAAGLRMAEALRDGRWRTPEGRARIRDLMRLHTVCAGQPLRRRLEPA